MFNRQLPMIPISWIPSGKLTVCYLKNRQVNYFYVPFSSIFNGYVELPEDLHGAPNHPFGNSFLQPMVMIGGRCRWHCFTHKKKSLFHRIFHEDPYFSVSFPLTSSYWGTLNTWKLHVFFRWLFAINCCGISQASTVVFWIILRLCRSHEWCTTWENHGNMVI